MGASITQDDMKDFFETSKSLQIKGLQRDIQSMGENIQGELKPELVDTNKEYEEAYYGDQNNIINEETIVDSFDSVNATAGMYTDKELDQQIAEMIEKTAEGKWKCRVCGKKATQKIQIKRHAETHIEGLSYSCPMCSKSSSTRHSLKQHISDNHTGFFTCTVCNKTGMTKHNYQQHNNKYHKNK